jgi:branched-chain amino acid transport system permease protein
MTRQKRIAWLIFVAVLIAIPWLLQSTAPQMLFRFCLVGIYGIVILGLDLLVGYSGQVNLGQQGFFAVGAYTTALLTTHRLAMLPAWFGEPILAMIIGVIVCLGVALVIAIPVLRTVHFYQAVVTLGFGMIVYTILLGLNITGGPGGIVGIPAFSFGSLKLNSDLKLFYLIWAIVVLVMLISGRFVKSRQGLASQALRSDELAASVMGINVYRNRLNLFLLSAVYGSIAGSLYAHLMSTVTPYDFSASVIIMMFLGLYFGGIHTLWGGIIGAILLQALNQAMGAITLVWVGVASMTDIINGIIFVLIIFFMPRGMVNKIYEIRRRKSQARGGLGERAHI